MDPNLVISILLAIGIALTFLGMDLIISARQVTLKKRLGDYKVPERLDWEGKKKAEGKAGAGGRFGQGLATELARADLPVTPQEYVVATFLFGLLGALLGFTPAHSLIGALVGGFLGLLAPRLYLIYLQHKHIEAFNSELENMLVLVSNTLRAGYGLSQAFETVAKESAPPLSTEFMRVIREIALGISTKEALANLLRRNPSGDLDLVITAINVNHEVGGSLSQVLDQIAGTIRDRVRLAAEISAITAMQRISAAVLIVMPILLAIVIYFMSPGYISLLWEGTCGFALLGTWLALMIIGILIIRRLLQFRY
jgi:tight adherence protein B